MALLDSCCLPILCLYLNLFSSISKIFFSKSIQLLQRKSSQIMAHPSNTQSTAVAATLEPLVGLKGQFHDIRTQAMSPEVLVMILDKSIV